MKRAGSLFPKDAKVDDSAILGDCVGCGKRQSLAQMKTSKEDGETVYQCGECGEELVRVRRETDDDPDEGDGLCYGLNGRLWGTRIPLTVLSRGLPYDLNLAPTPEFFA